MCPGQTRRRQANSRNEMLQHTAWRELERQHCINHMLQGLRHLLRRDLHDFNLESALAYLRSGMGRESTFVSSIVTLITSPRLWKHVATVILCQLM